MKSNRNTHVFGELEADIMEIVWERKRVSVRDVLEELSKKRKIAYTTVMTVMCRLFEKGVMCRELQDSGAYVYTACKDREAFMADVSKKMITDLIAEFGEVAVAQFIDIVTQSDVRKLSAWRKKLKKVK